MRKIVLLMITAVATLLATACGSSAPAAIPTPSVAVQTAPANGTVVNVTLADNTIKASQITFQAGVPYTFVVQNSGRHAHNFNINQPVSVAGSLNAALTNALLAVDEDELPVGATVTVDYTFPDSAVGQQLEFSCLIRRHYEDGMVLAITVTQ